MSEEKKVRSGLVDRCMMNEFQAKMLYDALKENYDKYVAENKNTEARKRYLKGMEIKMAEAKKIFE